MAQKRIIQDASKNMYRRMEQLGISEHELGSMIGEGDCVVSSWVNGRYNDLYYKPIYVFLNICDALGCTPSDLLGY